MWVCVHSRMHACLPEAGPVSRTKPASCPWEMHHWLTAAKLKRMEEKKQAVSQRELQYN